MVDNAAFGAAVRKVRCGKCVHVWHQEPPTEEQVVIERQVRKEQAQNLAQAAVAEKAGAKPNLPTVFEGKKAPKWLKAACWALFVANVFAFVLLNKPLIGQTAFYDMISDYDSSGVKIAEVKLLPSAKQGEYFFDFSLKNEKKLPTNAPHAQAQLLDKDKNVVVGSGIMKLPKMLEANGELKLSKQKMLDETEQARYLQIDIGNPYEIENR